MITARSLVAPTSNPLLERALADKLQRRSEIGGSLGELEPLAVRLGLMQNTLKPRFRDPQLLVFAADHGLAVDGIVSGGAPGGHLARPTRDTAQALLTNQLPLTVFARAQQLEVTVIDCGIADNMPAHDRLLMRKIAHGTRNARVTAAMSLEQAHAAMRAGMEIGEQTRRVDTLVTIGSPFDLLRTYWPQYFRNRVAVTGVPRRWINLYSPLDLLGSNFRNDAEPGDAERHFHGSKAHRHGAKQDDRIDPKPSDGDNIAYEQVTGGSRRTLLGLLTLQGLKVHSLYWEPRQEDERNCFTYILPRIYDADYQPSDANRLPAPEMPVGAAPHGEGVTAERGGLAPA